MHCNNCKYRKVIEDFLGEKFYNKCDYPNKHTIHSYKQEKNYEFCPKEYLETFDKNEKIIIDILLVYEEDLSDGYEFYIYQDDGFKGVLDYLRLIAKSILRKIK